MRTSKTEGFILKKRKLLEGDFLITLFTKQLGKLTTVAKGARKLISRRGPHLQTGNLINTILYKKHGRYYMQETALISAFSKIKSDELKINYQYLMIFIVDRLMPENQKEEEVYSHVKKFFIQLSESDFGVSDLEDYLNILIKKLGYLKNKQSLSELIETIENLIHERLPVNII
jgi:DNA repair protein RecO (recombination protein O)